MVWVALLNKHVDEVDWDFRLELKVSIIVLLICQIIVQQIVHRLLEILNVLDVLINGNFLFVIYVLFLNPFIPQYFQIINTVYLLLLLIKSILKSRFPFIYIQLWLYWVHMLNLINERFCLFHQLFKNLLIKIRLVSNHEILNLVLPLLDHLKMFLRCFNFWMVYL